MRNCGQRQAWQGPFRQCGHRMTRPREAILGVMEKTKDHLSAEDIYLKVHEFYPNIGLTTVYRNLELLVDLGLVVKFEFGHGKAKYELADKYSKKEHHHHLVCKSCARIIEYSDFMDSEIEFLKTAEKGLSKKYNFQITDHLIQFHGYCDKCVDKNQ